VLAFAFAGIWFAISAKTAHLPPVLQVIGAMLAIGVAALIGSAQTKFGLLRLFHPLVFTRLVTPDHPHSAAALAIFERQQPP
jgi:hypothetical protein